MKLKHPLNFSRYFSELYILQLIFYLTKHFIKSGYLMTKLIVSKNKPRKGNVVHDNMANTRHQNATWDYPRSTSIMTLPILMCHSLIQE